MPSIAIIGASADRTKFGNKAVRAYAQKGYTVYPIHPKEASIEGIPAFKSIADVPVEEIDRVSFYVAPAIGMKIIEEVARKKIGEVWFNPGSESDELLEKSEALGLNSIAACSLVDIGANPNTY
ncbi:MAG: CoA-binding protein [Bdellovibrionaceae bacterium]|nr:CoA-binding protein [Bdellovibrionales bacterium]MCB9254100.1 CoA-binding protein [Pseudobdellovibrionaceae bacterium]